VLPFVKTEVALSMDSLGMARYATDAACAEAAGNIQLMEPMCNFCQPLVAHK
jgi:hypothetical protein